MVYKTILRLRANRPTRNAVSRTTAGKLMRLRETRLFFTEYCSYVKDNKTVSEFINFSRDYSSKYSLNSYSVESELSAGEYFINLVSVYPCE